MKKLIFATSNPNKVREIREILDGMDYEILSMADAGIDVDIVEDGKTFADGVEKYLLEVAGVSQKDIDDFRALMLE